MLEFCCSVVILIDLGLLFLFIYQPIKHKKVFSIKNIAKFVPLVFCYAFLLFLTIYDGSDFFLYFFRSFNKGFEALVFKIYPDEIGPFLDNALFAFAFYLTALIQIYLYICLVVALFIKLVYNKLKLYKVRNQDHDVILTENDEYIESLYAKSYKNTFIWKKIPRDEFQKCKNKFAIINKNFDLKNLTKYVYKKKCRINFVSFIHDDYKSLKYLSTFYEAYDKYPDYMKNVYLYLECSFTNRYLFEKINNYKNISNNIFIFNKHKMIGQKLVFEQPIVKYIPQKYILKNGTINNKLVIKCLFVGFGKTNKEVCINSFLNNALVTTNGKNELVPYIIKYYAIDKEDNVTDKNINHYMNNLFLKEEDEKANNTKDEKEKANDTKDKEENKFINFIPENGNLNSSKIYNLFDEILANDKSDTFRQIFVSLGDDSDNLDISLKIIDILNRLNIKDNYVIMCRIKDKTITDSLKLSFKNIVFFGSDEEVINHDIITYRTLEKVGIMRNLKYHIVQNKALPKDALEMWNKVTKINQANSIFVGLNMRLKFKLLGLDFVNETSPEYKNIENSKAKIDKEGFNKKYYGDKQIPNNLYDYNSYYHNTKDPSLRNVLAFQEHLRWCRFMFYKGYNPMPFSNIEYIYDEKTDTIKVIKDDLETKVHACLVDFNELNSLHQYNKENLEKLGKKYNINAFDPKYKTSGYIDTYQYDYQTMDEAFDFLTNAGYIIFKNPTSDLEKTI